MNIRVCYKHVGGVISFVMYFHKRVSICCFHSPDLTAHVVVMPQRVRVGSRLVVPSVFRDPPPPQQYQFTVLSEAPLFYLTTAVCDFLPLLQPTCGWWAECAALIR
jgi:hypothetical protein